jgi:hypothetical protein
MAANVDHEPVSAAVANPDLTHATTVGPLRGSA